MFGKVEILFHCDKSFTLMPMTIISLKSTFQTLFLFLFLE
uniref:Uncharacterized protein n=1 Tax=Rhizophora mucronata TaxID=61149 RepID=A0A2P2K7Z7_RHIMU